MIQRLSLIQRLSRRRLFIAQAATTLLLGACGGDDFNHASSGGVGTESDTDLDDFTSAMGNMDDMAEMSGVPKECLEISMAMVGAMGGMGAVGGGIDDTQYLANLPAAFDALRSKAPAELHGDIDIVKVVYAKYFDILKKYDYDFTKLAANPSALEEMSAVMDNEKFEQASERFSTWLDSVCGDQ